MGPESLRIITDGIPLKVPDITSQAGNKAVQLSRTLEGARGQGRGCVPRESLLTGQTRVLVHLCQGALWPLEGRSDRCCVEGCPDTLWTKMRAVTISPKLSPVGGKEQVVRGG